ncbi:hypothetical protein AURDEDRAFT_131911, partial [Auricularia subglabra TFB-10046 SS5]
MPEPMRLYNFEVTYGKTNHANALRYLREALQHAAAHSGGYEYDRFLLKRTKHALRQRRARTAVPEGSSVKITRAVVLTGEKPTQVARLAAGVKRDESGAIIVDDSDDDEGGPRVSAVTRTVVTQRAPVKTDESGALVIDDSDDDTVTHARSILGSAQRLGYRVVDGAIIIEDDDEVPLRVLNITPAGFKAIKGAGGKTVYVLEDAGEAGGVQNAGQAAEGSSSAARDGTPLRLARRALGCIFCYDPVHKLIFDTGKLHVRYVDQQARHGPVHVVCCKKLFNADAPIDKTKCPICRKMMQLSAPAYELNDFAAALAGDAMDIDAAAGAKSLTAEIEELNTAVKKRVRGEDDGMDFFQQIEARGQRRRRGYGRH